MLCTWLALSRFLVHTHQAFITLPQVVPCSSTALPNLFCTCRAAAADARSHTPLTLEPQRPSRRAVDALAGWTVQGLEHLRSRTSALDTTQDSSCSTDHTQVTQCSVTHDDKKCPDPPAPFNTKILTSWIFVL